MLGHFEILSSSRFILCVSRQRLALGGPDFALRDVVTQLLKHPSRTPNVSFTRDIGRDLGICDFS